MKSRLARLWPLWLFLAAAAVSLCVFAHALPQTLVLQGPDGVPNLSRPGLWRRAAEWICRGTPCLDHENLIKVLLPALVGHELFYVVSAGLVALGIGLYLRLVGLPVAACFGGGLAMAFSGYHFTLFNAGHRGYASMVAYAALMLPLLESAVRSPRAAWAAFPLLGVCAVCGLATQPDVMAFLLLLEIAYGVFRVAQLAAAEGPRPFLAPRWRPWLAGAVLALAAFGAFGFGTVRHVFGEVVAGRVAQMESFGAKALSEEESKADPAAAEAAARERWIFATNWSLPPEDMAEFVAPNLRGYDTGFASAPYWGRIGRSEDWEATGQGYPNFRQHSIYLGALGVALALFAAVGAFCDLRRRNGDGSAEEGVSPALALFWAAAALVSILLALGRFGFLYRLFYHLPMMDKVRAPLKFMHLAEVCVSILLAFGLARLGREPGRREKLAAKISIVLLALAGLALAAASFGFDPAAHAKILAAVGAPVGSAAARELARLYGSGLTHGAWLFALAAAAIGLCAFLPAPRRAAVARVAAWALAAAAALDLAVVARGYARTDDVSVRYAGSAPATDLMKRHPTPDGLSYSYILLTRQPIGPQSIQPLFGAVEQAGYTLADPLAGDGPDGHRVRAFRTLGDRIPALWAYWGTAGVFVPREVAPQFIQAGAARIAGLYDFAPGPRLVRAADLRKAQVAMLEPNVPSPSVAVFHGWRTVADGAPLPAFFDRIAENDFDILRELVLAEGGGGAEHPATRPPEPAEWVVAPSSNEGRRAVVRYDAKEDGVLFVREARTRWFPRIRATVDGTPADVLRANGPFLAVRVPSGPHEVVLEPIVPWGRYALPAIGWAAVLALAALWARRSFAR